MSGLDGAAPKPITPASLLKAIGAAFDARAARQDDRDVAHA
jgi:hypothetical protein